MKKNTRTGLLTALAAAWTMVPMQAQDIVYNGGGGADLTFYYESETETWHSVFRAKGTTGEPTTVDATGLTSPFGGYTGIVGNVVPAQNGDTGDYSFSSLTVNVNTTTQQKVNGNNYWLTSASGSPFLSDGSTPDLGIRTRLREDFGSGTVQQFDSFNFTLNLGASTYNGNPLSDLGSPNFVLLNWDGVNNPVPMIETVDGNNTAEFGNYAHVHRNFGFSEFGQYNLVFDIDGVGGTYGSGAPTGQVGVGFNVIPEPSTLMLFGLGMGLMARVLRRKLRG